MTSIGVVDVAASVSRIVKISSFEDEYEMDSFETFTISVICTSLFAVYQNIQNPGTTKIYYPGSNKKGLSGITLQVLPSMDGRQLMKLSLSQDQSLLAGGYIQISTTLFSALRSESYHRSTLQLEERLVGKKY